MNSLEQNNRIKILLVEDNEVDQFAFKRHAEKNDLPYDITVCPSMEETFLLLRTQSFDVVILDYMLKDGASAELVPHLLKKMQVIFVTGEDKLEVAINAMKMGVYEYIVKDFNKTYLGMLPKIIDSAYKHKVASDRLKRAEKQVSRLSLAMANMNKSVIISDRTGRIVWVNQAFTKLTGYDPSEILGSYGELLTKGGINGLKPGTEMHKEVFFNKSSVNYESVNYDKNGKEMHLLSTMSPILNEEGELDEVVVVETDITNQKKIEHELREAKLKAEASDKAKEQFLANMSHELRTPLNAIMGMEQMMQHTKLSKDQKEYMKIVKESSQNLLVLIRDILDFSKINAGVLSLNEKSFNLIELLNRMEHSFKLRVNSDQVDLKFVIDPDVPANVFADPNRLEQILANVITNSIKFTDKGSIELFVSTDKDGSELNFKLSDTGIGIAQDKLDIIFEMFQQVDVSDTRKYDGAGIGLSIVKSLTELMKGSVKLRSEIDKGTSVFLTLPMEKATGDTLQSPSTSKGLDTNTDLSGTSVLLVEDNKMNQLLAQKFLMKLGAKVTVAGNGEEAVAQLKESQFDLVLMDLQMPVMDGFEATRIIRENLDEPKNNVPIIAMTAHAIRGVEEKCFELGLTDFISKPILLNSLKEKMANALAH